MVQPVALLALSEGSPVITIVRWIILAAVFAIAWTLFKFGDLAITHPLTVGWRTFWRTREGGVVVGEAVSLERTGADDVVTVIQFHDQHGAVRHFRSRFRSTRTGYAIGDRMRVSFDPRAPEDAQVLQNTSTLLGSLLLGLALMVLAGLIVQGLWRGAFSLG
ncbi:MAG: DUF3592 domain-containing protein [Vicinamibacteraceae bacterium]